MRKLSKALVATTAAATALFGARAAMAAGVTGTGPAYSKTATASATTNTADFTITASAGETIVLSTQGGDRHCTLPGAAGTGDTYLRLFFGQTQVAYNDDANDTEPSCNVGYTSYLKYKVPAGAGGTYTVKAGCYGSGSCTGTVAWRLSDKSGIVLLHGTGDYAGANLNGVNTINCYNSGDSFYCKVPSSPGKDATSDYWGQGFVDSLRKRADGTMRPYAVLGCNLASRMPWYNAAPIGDSDTSVAGESGTADCAAEQMETFVKGPDGSYGTADDIDDLVVITHSGGANVIRHITVTYTATTAKSRAKTAMRKVVALAPPWKGTYLANWVISGGSTSSFINGAVNWLAGKAGYGDDGVKFIQTGDMDLHNGDTSKFKAGTTLGNPVNGVTFRSAYGTFPDSDITDGKTRCGGGWTGSYPYQVALWGIHKLFLSQTDASTYRNGCSDGFLTCQSMSALGQVFNIAAGKENSVDGFRFVSHHQSRRTHSDCKTCGWLQNSTCYSNVESTFDKIVRNEVNATAMALTETPAAAASSDAMPSQWDTCLFTQAGWIEGASPAKYTKGCPKSYLGDGWCDPECLAGYGHDAVPTWNDATTKDYVVSWGNDDCLMSSAKNPFHADFAGDRNGDGTVETYEIDDMAYCPDSWQNDGYCDACWLAKGGDGNDCLPGKVSACGGPYVEGDVNPGRARWHRLATWSVVGNVCGDNVCGFDECNTCPSDCAGYCN